MTKITKTRKEIIKNIAIVFLAVMLVLTFFSNTIMNWSLAQVNGAYSEYGEIRTGVRGSGTVQANTVFEQAVKGSQRVDEVFVREGDRVVEGQVLMVLELSASYDNAEQIKALEDQLKTLRDAYDRALLARDGAADYTLAEMDIEDAREELEELKAKRAELTDERIAEIEKEYTEAEQGVVLAQDRIEALEERITELSEKSEDEEIVAARVKRDNAKSALDYATKCLEKAQEEFAGISFTDLTSLENQKTAVSRTLTNLYDEKSTLESDNANLLAIESDKDNKKKAWDDAKALYESLEDGTSEKDAALTVMQTAESEYNSAYALYETNLEDIKEAKSAIKAVQNQIDAAIDEQNAISRQLSNAKSDNKEYSRLKTAVENNELLVENAQTAYDTATEALNKAVEGISDDLSSGLKIAKNDLKTAEKRFEDAKEMKAEADATEALDEEIKTSERALFELEYNLENQKKEDEKTEALEDFDFKKQKEEIDALGAEILELKGNTSDGKTEFLSKYNGVVTSFTSRVGDTLADGESVISIESDESGYTLSFSVSNADSKKVQIGDSATVSGGWWGTSVEAVLSSIKTEQGGKTKLLTFDIHGDVMSGQTLTLIAGEKSTSYSSVVPKSAVHEDSDGKFVYITKTKSTPLGNRYVATRLPVDVVASDDVNCAISSKTETYLYEFVITSSTKPFADGDFVRLAD